MAKLVIGLYNHQFKTDDKYLYHKGVYGNNFKVLKSDIESVSVEGAGMFKSILKINGHGTCLAKLKTNIPWAEKAQEFVQKEILDSRAEKNDDKSNVDDLEKLFTLKEKGVITQEEFETKKKQILEL